MVYLNIVMGLGVVLVAAAAAIYFSRPNYQQTPPHHHRRNNRDEDDGEFDNGRSLHGHFTQQRTRRSKPGDKCTVCLDKMNQGHMHEMKCGHALHKDCFEEYRYLRRNCPLCSQTVNLSLPGDDCSICLDPLKRSDMVHLRCQHAMHQICHTQFIDSGAKVCPLCLQEHFTQQRTRRSKPGDKCSECLDKMNQGQMHEMKCGHALHKDCFEEYRYLRRNCPLCSQTVNLNLPGDDCSICLDPLKRSDMVHLRCQHAMHQICHVQFIDSGAKVCPLCREGL